jgi:hypothetical protein
MGEIPHLDRAIGLPQSERGRQREYEKRLTDVFIENGHQPIPELELEKTERDRELLRVAQEAVDDYLARYGRAKRIQIPPANIHVLAIGGVDKVTKGRHLEGAASFMKGSVIIDRVPSDSEFVLIAFHELFHLKSYSALQITRQASKVNPRLVEYRQGFTVVNRDGTEEYFANLEEAVVAHFTHRFYQDYLKANRSQLFSNTVATTEAAISRSDELDLLDRTVDHIWENNRGTFRSREQVLDLFIRAQVNGDLLPIARLVERTYGKGAFRRLGKTTGGPLE